MTQVKAGQVANLAGATHVLSFGGGVNTTALMILLVRKKMPFDVAVFADTGTELPETYDAVKVATEYLNKHGIEMRTVRSKAGTLYETCKRRKVIPSKIWRWSTRDYKITPIHAYYRSLGTHVNEYLGIAYDEIERMKESKEGNITSIFPLIDNRLTRIDCVKMIRSARLPVPIKSGCFICPFVPIWRWEYIYRHHKDLYKKAMELEEQSKFFPKQKLAGQTLRGLVEKDFKVPGKLPMINDEPCGAYCLS